jgi:hypothetical protein
MATATDTEYIEIDGIPLSTAAWTTEDIASLIDGPGVRGQDLVVPTRAGAVARRRILDARTFSLPIVVAGYYDSDGVPHADPRAGLQANIDELKSILSPDGLTLTGTRTLRWVRPNDYAREAEVHLNPAVAMRSVGPHAVRMVITGTIPGGALRGQQFYGSTSLVSTGAVQTTFSITVGGTGEVQDAILELPGRPTWPGPFFTISAGSGPPTFGSGSTGDWYFDTDEDPPALYGPRESGGAWPGPHEYTYSASAPTTADAVGADYWVVGTGGLVTGGIYGERTIAAPDLTDLVVSNRTYDPTDGVFIQYLGTVDDAFVLDAGDYSATVGSTDVSGAIISGGSPIWLPLQPGINTIRLEADITAGTAIVVRWRPVWL